MRRAGKSYGESDGSKWRADKSDEGWWTDKSDGGGCTEKFGKVDAHHGGNGNVGGCTEKFGKVDDFAFGSPSEVAPVEVLRGIGVSELE